MPGAKKILFACILTLCGAATMAQKAEQPFLSVDGKMYYPRDFFNPYFEAYLKSDNKAAFTPESFIETFANDIVMLNQAAADRGKLGELLNISREQMGYITNAEAGCGLLRYGGAIVPFANRFPRDTELYRLMTTKPGE